MGFTRRNSRFFRVMNGFIFINLILRIGFVGIFTWLKSPSLIIYALLSAIIWLVTVFINRNGDQRLAFFIALIDSMLFSSLATVTFGWESGFYFLLIEIDLLIFINSDLRKNSKFLLGAILSIFLILLFFVSRISSPFQPIDWKSQNIIFSINLAQGLIALGMLGYFFELSATKAEKEIILANQRLLNMANTDPVTNLINRRIMMNKIEAEKEKVDKGGKPFSVIMVDIDNFKQINDEYGHDGGDFVLVSLAEKISISLRKTDLVSRWGGDEFLLLLPETDLLNSQAVAEKVRERIVRSPFIYRELDIPVTVTFGVGLCDVNVGVGSCIRKADQALYRGKQAGKNQVVV